MLPVLRARIPKDALAWAEAETGVPRDKIAEVAREIRRAGSAFASHVWRNTAAGNLGGWQVSRCLELLSVLVGAVGTKGGTLPNTWNKFVPAPFMRPGPQSVWSELLFPREYPFSHYEMSYLLPHLLREGRGKLSTYFTRVYNPVWTNPDGTAWMEMLTNEAMIGLHAALTPTWSETAMFADYVLPMGHGPERHDIQSQETQSGKWLGFRQPVLRVARERMGETFEHTYQANPGEVWEEDEFWMNLSWRVDPDGKLGVRKFFESPIGRGSGSRSTNIIVGSSRTRCRGSPRKRGKLGFRRWTTCAATAPSSSRVRTTRASRSRSTHRWHRRPRPTRNRESSRKMGKRWGRRRRDPLCGIPDAIAQARDLLAHDGRVGLARVRDALLYRIAREREGDGPLEGEYPLIPTFRLPTLIHTRSGNAKWLYELSNTNPLWVHPIDAKSWD